MIHPWVTWSFIPLLVCIFLTGSKRPSAAVSSCMRISARVSGTVREIPGYPFCVRGCQSMSRKYYSLHAKRESLRQIQHVWPALPPYTSDTCNFHWDQYVRLPQIAEDYLLDTMGLLCGISNVVLSLHCKPVVVGSECLCVVYLNFHHQQCDMYLRNHFCHCLKLFGGSCILRC
jgi:hypothetical protein